MVAISLSILRPRILPLVASRRRWSSLSMIRFFAELLPEDPVFRQQVIDGLLLSIIDPTGEDQEEQLPWLQNEVHMSPDAGLTRKNSIGHRRSAVNRKEQAGIDIYPSSASCLKTTT